MTNKTLSTRPNGITSIFNEFLEPWNEWFTDSRLNKSHTTPKVNITETKDSYNLAVGAPGLHKKDFNINVDGDVLTVSAEHESDKEETDEKYHRQEYNYSSFSRSFNIPAQVAKDKIEASYDGGVLNITMPKTETAARKTGSTITVK